MGYRTYTCPISRRCGGCEWLSVPYPIQLRRKQEEVERLFTSVCREDGCTVGAIRGMDEPCRFRQKAAAPFAPGKGGRVRSGFYEGNSHRIVWCEKCLVENPQGRTILNDVARVTEQLRIPAYEEDRGRGVLRNAVVRCGYATDEVLLTVVTNGERLPHAERFVRMLRSRHPEITSIVQNVNSRRTNAILGRSCVTLWGPGVMHDELLGCRFEIGPTSFYQTNPAQTETLYKLAIEKAGLHEGMRVLDAYCGTGTIGICMAAAARDAGIDGVRVTGIEQVGAAVSCARRNAQANELGATCSFVCADATAYLRTGRRKHSRRHYDVVVMDPPRAGSTPEFLASVAGLSPMRIVYVSCNPKTQLRDLTELRRHDYRVDSIEPVDMFPHTKHVETVVLMTRTGRTESRMLSNAVACGQSGKLGAHQAGGV